MRGVAVAEPVVEHRRDIQGLRAVAVLLVILDHAGVGWLSGGFVGVDVFFVISGYLITRLLLGEAASTGTVRIGDFYARRARRILPAATVVIVVTMTYAARELSLPRVQLLRGDALWSAFFGANVHFARLETDYFAQARAPSPFQHYWSLAVEEQFYLVWPLLLALLLIIMARRGGSDVRGFTWLLAITITASLAWSLLQTRESPGTAYYSSVARAWELAVGAMVAVHQSRLVGLGRSTRRYLGVAGLVAVATAAVVYDASSAFPGWRALLPVLGAGALVAAGAGGATGASRVLTLTPLVWLGDLSYSLYLWQWPLLVLGPTYSAALGGTGGTALLLAATVVAAFATFHLVENPLRRNSLLRPGRRSLALWPLALGAVVLSVVLAEHQSAGMLEARIAGSQADRQSSAAGAVQAADAPRRGAQGGARDRESSAAEPSLADRLTEALELADSGAPVPFPLTNLPDASADGFPMPPHCVIDPPETSTKVCPIGRTDAPRTMVVLGDSQAGEWLPAIDRMGQREGFRVLPLIKLGCTPFDVPSVDGGGADFWQCTAFRTWAADYIADVRPQIVIVGSEATSDRLYPAPGRDLAQTWTAGVASLLDRLQRLGADVIVLADTPDFAFDPVECLTDPDSSLNSCVGTPHDGLIAANASTREVASQSGAGYIDTVSLVCVLGRCPLVVDRTMTFWDYSHIAAAWSAALADDFTRLYLSALAQVRERPSAR